MIDIEFTFLGWIIKCISLRLSLPPFSPLFWKLLTNEKFDPITDLQLVGKKKQYDFNPICTLVKETFKKFAYCQDDWFELIFRGDFRSEYLLEMHFSDDLNKYNAEELLDKLFTFQRSVPKEWVDFVTGKYCHGGMDVCEWIICLYSFGSGNRWWSRGCEKVTVRLGDDQEWSERTTKLNQPAVRPRGVKFSTCNNEIVCTESVYETREDLVGYCRTVKVNGGVFGMA